jgi:polysaccharide biosynthesis transport protein
MEDPPNRDALQLRSWLTVLRRRWVVLVVTVSVLLALALVYLAFRTPSYVAQAQVATSAGTTEATSGGSTLDVEGLAELVRSIEVAGRVRQQLGRGVTPTVDVSGTDILTISVAAKDPAFAADAANTVADALVAVRVDEAQAQVAEAAQQLQQQINDVDTRIDALPASTARDDPARTELVRERAAYADALSELRVQSVLTRLNGERVISRAVAPTLPSQESAVAVLVLAVVLGTVLGAGLVGLVEFADDRVRSRRDDPLGGHLPLLTTLPRRRARPFARPHPGTLATIEDPSGAVADAYRALRSLLLTPAVGDAPRVLLLASCDTTSSAVDVATNLAVTTARGGTPTLLVDCDFRRSFDQSDVLDALFVTGVETASRPGGLATLMHEDVVLDDVISLSTVVPDLSILASGVLDGMDPGDLLVGDEATWLVGELSSRKGVVLLLAPPVLRAPETATLAALADASILVVRAGGTRRRSVSESIQRLVDVGAERVGAVMLTH